MCSELLAHPVVEDYAFRVEPRTEPSAAGGSSGYGKSLAAPARLAARARPRFSTSASSALRSWWVAMKASPTQALTSSVTTSALNFTCSEINRVPCSL